MTRAQLADLAADAVALSKEHADRADALRESIAAHVEALAANYPEDVFPADGTSRDAIGGTAMRHAYRNAARSIREDFEITTGGEPA
jgi:hypothetical protein